MTILTLKMMITNFRVRRGLICKRLEIYLIFSKEHGLIFSQFIKICHRIDRLINLLSRMF